MLSRKYHVALLLFGLSFLSILHAGMECVIWDDVYSKKKTKYTISDESLNQSLLFIANLLDSGRSLDELCGEDGIIKEPVLSREARKIVTKFFLDHKVKVLEIHEASGRKVHFLSLSGDGDKPSEFKLLFGTSHPTR